MAEVKINRELLNYLLNDLGSYHRAMSEYCCTETKPCPIQERLTRGRSLLFRTSVPSQGKS